MRKVLLGLALLAPSFASAQTLPVRGQSGYDTGAVVNCTSIDGSSTSRCLMPGYIQYDASGNVLGTSANPYSVNSAPDATGAGTLPLATNNATYVIPLAAGKNAVGLTVTGLTGSGATITVERSNNGGTTWTNANTTESSAAGSLSATITADGQARVGVAGATNIRLRVSTVGTGTATIAYTASTAAGPVFLTSYLPGRATPDGLTIGGVDNRWINGIAISSGAGLTDTGTQRVVQPTDYVGQSIVRGGGNIVSGQVSVGTTATLIAAARTGRQSIQVILTAANTCYFGPSTVTTTTGYPITGTGASDKSDTSAALYAVCSATTNVGFKELF